MEAVKSALLPSKKGKHKTLVDEFAYPKKGTGQIYSKTKTKIENADGKVLLNSPVDKVLLDNGMAKGVQLKNGETIFAIANGQLPP